MENYQIMKRYERNNILKELLIFFLGIEVYKNEPLTLEVIIDWELQMEEREVVEVLQ